MSLPEPRQILTGRSTVQRRRAVWLVWFALACSPDPASAQSHLIQPGSVWRYLDDGTDQGTNWLSADYDDSAWSRGAAELGYGDGDETTIIRDLGGAPPTVYFRYLFVVDGSPFQAFTNATLRFLADDGAAIYLNGTELYRHNLPAGNVHYLTEATVQVGGEAEREWIQRSLYRGYMVPGTNVLAVSLHQYPFPLEEHDASFDLEVIVDLPLTPPTVRLVAPTNGTVVTGQEVLLVPEYDDADGHMYRIDYLANGVKFGESLEPPFAFLWRDMPRNQRYRLQAWAIDNSGRSSYSQNVYVQIGTVSSENLIRGPYLQMGGTNRMTIKWRTDWFTDTRLLYGYGPSDLDFTVLDTNRVIDHEVHLTGLEPNRRYYYAIGTSQRLFWPGVAFNFRTSPMTAKPTRVWVIGDSGTADANAAAVLRAYESRTGDRATDVWLMLGDNAYEQGTDEQYQRAVFDTYLTLLPNTVLWPTLGNHDASLPQDGSFPYLDIFSLPRQAEAGGVASGTEAYYSFDYGNIHFLCLDSQTTDRSTNSPMWQWAEADLAATTRDWIVAYWHHPPYSKGTHDSDRETQLIEMRERALPLLERYGVDLVLTGHSHVYERSYLLNGHYGYATNLQPDMILDRGSGDALASGPYRKPAGLHGSHRGTVYAVCGCSGEGGGFRVPDHPAMHFSRPGFGSMILEFDGWRLDAGFIDELGIMHDRFTIVKNPASTHDGPRLRIEPAAAPPDHMEVSWPETRLSYELEARSAAERETETDGDWRSVTNAPYAREHRRRVLLDRSADPTWFRLREEQAPQ